MNQVRRLTFEERDTIHRECSRYFYAYTDIDPLRFRRAATRPDIAAICRVFDAIGWEPEGRRDVYDVAVDTAVEQVVADQIGHIDEYMAESWSANVYDSRADWHRDMDKELESRSCLSRLLVTEREA